MTEEQLRAAPDFRVSSDDQQHSHSQAFYRIPPSGRAI
jgi:hypothetical protein